MDIKYCRDIVSRCHSISVLYRGGSRGRASPPPPLKFSRLPPLGAIFLSAPPNSVEILDPPLHYHSISMIRLGVFFALNLFVHDLMIFFSFFILSVLCLPGCAFNKANGFENGYYWFRCSWILQTCVDNFNISISLHVQFLITRPYSFKC
jgi:hypothetical protein